jgi:LmbE family N-acetylglucosaminyl deacetylase
VHSFPGRSGNSNEIRRLHATLPAMHVLRSALAAVLLTSAPCLAGGAGTALALPPIDAATTLLVVSPHPDDETLCCGGVIQRVLRAGGHVSVLWITSGDAERMGLLMIEHVVFTNPARARQFGVQRMAEARAATSRLGVGSAGQLFLGYPDGGLRELLDAPRASVYTSRSTRASSVPYADALFPGQPYSAENLERDFATVLERVQPTLILAPSPEDTHPDHRATGLLAITVSRRSGLLPRVRYWIVHGGEGWPSPRGLMPGIPLRPAPRSRGLEPVPFALPPPEEDGKLHALEAYDTQMRVMAPFLLAFVRTTELFASRATLHPLALQAPTP